jgi:hypothetical protein
MALHTRRWRGRLIRRCSAAAAAQGANTQARCACVRNDHHPCVTRPGRKPWRSSKLRTGSSVMRHGKAEMRTRHVLCACRAAHAWQPIHKKRAETNPYWKRGKPLTALQQTCNQPSPHLMAPHNPHGPPNRCTNRSKAEELSLSLNWYCSLQNPSYIAGRVDRGWRRSCQRAAPCIWPAGRMSASARNHPTPPSLPAAPLCRTLSMIQGPPVP